MVNRYGRHLGGEGRKERRNDSSYKRIQVPGYADFSVFCGNGDDYDVDSLMPRGSFTMPAFTTMTTTQMDDKKPHETMES